MTVTLDDQTFVLEGPRVTPATNAGPAPHPPRPSSPADSEVRLGDIAWARSGDKGDICNIGIVARRPEYLPHIAQALDADAMGRFYAHMFVDEQPGKVERYYLPGSNSLNFMLYDALDGGCTASMRFDPLGKSAAQEILDMVIPIASSALLARAEQAA